MAHQDGFVVEGRENLVEVLECEISRVEVFVLWNFGLAVAKQVPRHHGKAILERGHLCRPTLGRHPEPVKKYDRRPTSSPLYMYSHGADLNPDG